MPPSTSETTTRVAPRATPPAAPVYEHRDWRHLQRAAVAAHRQLGAVTQKHFCAHMAPAASIAVWILQHAPHLARQTHLSVVIAQANEFLALDMGRWLQFIPWLLGRPDMKLSAAVVCNASESATQAVSDPEAAEHRLRSHSWAAVRGFEPATIYVGSLAGWLAAEQARVPGFRPDLCAVFTPSLTLNHDTLLAGDGLPALWRLHAPVPSAMFSPTEAEQLADVYTLAAAGLALKDPEYWPNPWALPVAEHERVGAFAKMGWAAEFEPDSVAAHLGPVVPDSARMRALAETIDYAEEVRVSGGADAVLQLGEPLRAAGENLAPLSSNDAATSVLIRLPRDTGVDLSNGYIYQLQGTAALLLGSIPQVPGGALDSFPGTENLLPRAIWAVAVHRAHVAPFVQELDEALASHFSALDSHSGPGPDCPNAA